MCKARELARKYEGILSIKCGMEIDYYPSVMSEIQAVLDDGEFDLPMEAVLTICTRTENTCRWQSGPEHMDIMKAGAGDMTFPHTRAAMPMLSPTGCFTFPSKFQSALGSGPRQILF